MHSHIPKESFCLPVEVKWDLQLNKHEHTHTHTNTHTKAHECYTYQQKMKQTVPRCLPAQVRRVKSCKDSDLGPKQQTHAVAHFPGLEKNLHVRVCVCVLWLTSLALRRTCMCVCAVAHFPGLEKNLHVRVCVCCGSLPWP